MSTQIIHINSPIIGENSQSPFNISANTIFLACNFENKRVKGHFDILKKEWEETLPVRVYLSDQVQGKGARDLWKDITQAIIKANLAIFDVTSFRPNVILELGFALAHKQTNNIILCRDLTPSGKKSTRQRKWLLSDISNLHRIEYKTFDILDEQLTKHVEAMKPVKNFYRLTREIERQKNLSAKLYVPESLEALLELRDNGSMLRREFRSRLEDREVDAKTIENLLKRFDLAKPGPGRNGHWMLID